MLKIYKNTEKNLLIKKLNDRAENIPEDIMTTVAGVIKNVRANGDEAVRDYCRKFDKTELDSFYLSDEEIEKYIAATDDDLKAVIDRATDNIRRFHEGQLQQSRIYDGGTGLMGQRVMPLNKVGVYVPGGTAAYPSSVLMNIIPAKTAGVKNVIMATPPKAEGLNPSIVYSAVKAGADKIMTVGGAQAVAALAYGTESIPRVDKIVGPGNIFVAMAKKLVYGAVDIDMIAGPSEILVIADEDANPEYIAADLLSQAEHDPLAASILISTSEELIKKADIELEKQLAQLERCGIAERSIKTYGSAISVGSLEEAAELSNTIAPEHLELAIKQPFEGLPLIRNAGSVFLGQYAPEPLGDYYAGPNHVLPTNGTARFASPLSCDSFIKKSSFLYYSKEQLEAASDDVIRFAYAEGLTAHANSIKIRRKNK